MQTMFEQGVAELEVSCGRNSADLPSVVVVSQSYMVAKL
jgi:hypothetical protein